MFVEEDPGAPGVCPDTDGWVMRGDGLGNYEVAFDLGGISLEARVTPSRGPVFHYKGTGLADFGADGWVFSYSYTRQNMAGHVRDGSGRRPVAGTGWYEHQWGQLDYRSVGWDWLGVQLDDGSDLTVTLLRSPASGRRLARCGTHVSPEGEALHLDEDAVSVQPTRTWVSPDTGAAYPVAWTVESGPLDLRLEVAAAHEQAEFPGRVSCWEGAIHAKGTRGGTPVSGKGFAALVGYAPRQLEDTADPPRT